MTAAGASPRGLAPATGPGGSIYDLGYQGYDGPRLGRRAARSALLFQIDADLLRDRPRRTGQDRPVRRWRGLAILPAILAVGIAALAAQAGAGGGASRPGVADPLRRPTTA